jgi:diketogulonate reductase-like aldo/keto reductase
VYITTKITAGCDLSGAQCLEASPEAAIASVNASLKNLQTTYIDMILLHRPCEQTKQKCSIAPKLSNCSGPVVVKDATAANNKLWAGLQQAKKMGLVKSIGVSNYFAGQLAALEGEKPAINQCEMSIQGYDNATIRFCQQNNIVYESYGSMR